MKCERSGLMTRDAPYGIEDVFMHKVSRVVVADAGSKLKDGCLKRHDQNGAKPERGAEKHPDQQYDKLHTELDKSDRGLWKMLSDDHHQGITRSAAQAWPHIKNRRKRDNGLPYYGQCCSDKLVLCIRKEIENPKEQIRKPRYE